MFSVEAFLVFFVLLRVVVCAIASVRILSEYEPAVVFTLGRFQRLRAQASFC
jgi:regulator of protease activity HflC (stomatin/prohibitin superfamily)